MNSNALICFHDFLILGHGLNPNGKSKESLREETKILNYANGIRCQVKQAVPSLSPTEKPEFLRYVYLLYRDTCIKRLSIYQFKTLLARRNAVDLIEFIYKVALKLEGSELLNSDSFWNYLIKFVELKNTALDKAGEQYLVRVWCEVISELVPLNGEDCYTYPDTERDVLAVIQSVNTSRKFNASKKALAIIRISSYSPIVAAQLVKLAILDSVNPGASTPVLVLIRLLDHRPMVDTQKVRIIRNLFGVVQNVSFLRLVFSNLTDPWFLEIFGNKADTYSFRLAQMEKIFVLNAGVFKKFEWGRMMELDPSNDFPKRDLRVMFSNGSTYNCLVILIHELLRNYSIPSYFGVKYLHQSLSMEETEIFLYLVGGGNLSRYSKLPVKLTNRQVYYFTHFEEVLTIKPFDAHYYQVWQYKFAERMGPDAFEIPKDFVKLPLQTALAWVVCLDELLSRFSTGNNTLGIRGQLEMHAKAIHLLKVILSQVANRYNLLKWISILPPFLYRNSDLIDQHKIEEVLDYINNYIIRNQVAVNFKTKSWVRLLAESDDWHRRIQEAAKLERNKNIFYPFLGIPDIHILYDDNVYLVKQILSREELRLEGLMMGHCVYSYDPMCAYEETYIFRVQVLCEDKWQSKLTIQVIYESNKVKIVQAKGKYNREPCPEEKIFLQKWLAKARPMMKKARPTMKAKKVRRA